LTEGYSEGVIYRLQYELSNLLPTNNIQVNDYAFIIDPWNNNTKPILKKYVYSSDGNNNFTWNFVENIGDDMGSTTVFNEDQWANINTALDELNSYKTESTDTLNAYKTLVSNTYATIANLNNKMDKVNPTGSGSIVVGANNVNDGKNCAVFGESNTITSFVEYSSIEGCNNKLGEDYEIISSYEDLMNLDADEAEVGQLYYVENSWIDEYDNNHEYPSGFYRYTGGAIQGRPYIESADPIRGAHAEGNNTMAIGDYSHAEGGSSYAIGPESHAEGGSTTAQGNASHAEGARTEANGHISHAEGNGTIANGYYSHSEGGWT